MTPLWFMRSGAKWAWLSFRSCSIGPEVFETTDFWLPKKNGWTMNLD